LADAVVAAFGVDDTRAAGDEVGTFDVAVGMSGDAEAAAGGATACAVGVEGFVGGTAVVCAAFGSDCGCIELDDTSSGCD